MLSEDQIKKIRSETPKVMLGYGSYPVLDVNAFARAIEAVARKDERERCVMALNELSKMRRIDFQNAIEEAVAAIRALKDE